ncbi:MAG: DnaJ domain-containing protein [Proteobacteria bacterium]|nr:DnaJ domain-containing protein [Pseudomonadota bacterium]
MSEFQDYYTVLGVKVGCSGEAIKQAFRKRLMEVHPDKSEFPRDPDEMRRLLEAHEVLSNPDRRDVYDRMWNIVFSEDLPGRTPHVTESDRPAARARSILFLLLEQRTAEAMSRLNELGPGARLFLNKHLTSDEFVDSCFLIGEYLEESRQKSSALEWYEDLLRTEVRRQNNRPCYPEARDKARRLLLKKVGTGTDPRVALEYLRRAEQLGLDRQTRGEVAGRRAVCYLKMDMKVEAGKHFSEAFRILPKTKMLTELGDQLTGYLDG